MEREIRPDPNGRPDSPTTHSRRPTTLVVPTLLATHVALLVYGAIVHFPTRNEVAHVPAGAAAWNTGTFALYRVNPPLPRLLAAAPVLLAGADASSVTPRDLLSRREEWEAARTFANANALHYLTLMRLARLPGVVWSLVGAWVVWRWAGEVYGRTAGLVALAVWCLGPTINAHAQLATPDLPAAVAGLAATYVFRHYLLTPRLDRAVAAGAALGVALLCKFTLLVLYPAWGMLVVAALASRWPGGHLRPTSVTVVGHTASLCATSIVLLNAGYLFEGSFTALGDYSFTSRTFTCEPVDGTSPRGDNRFRGTWVGAVPVPLPYYYVSGIDLQRADFEGNIRSYLRGEWANRGWWYFYLYAVGVKTPLGVLGLLLVGFALTAGRPSFDDLVVWIPGVAIFVFVSSQTGFTVHSRYVLPALPFFLIAAARTGCLLNRKTPLGGALVVGLLLWAGADTGRKYPHTLSYFNELAGGPLRGHQHLGDSNIDWGQDLLLLKSWADAHPDNQPLYLAYDNYVDHRLAGFVLLPSPTDPPADYHPSRVAPGQNFAEYGPRPGYIAVDVSNLLSNRYNYLRSRSPVAMAGYSIYIYYFSPDDAATVRREMGLPLLPP